MGVSPCQEIAYVFIIREVSPTKRELEKKRAVKQMNPHVMFWVPFFVLALDSALCSVISGTRFCVRSKIVDFIFCVGHMSEVARMKVEKTIRFLDRQP
jgi:hypothetical protein